MLPSQTESYSAEVSMHLYVNGDKLNVAKLGSGRCILRNPKPHVARAARLEISIDGQTETTGVFLPDGVSAKSREVRYRIQEVTSQQG